LSKAESKRNPQYSEVWNLYGPEIEAQTAHLPLQMKLSVSFWNDAASLVLGRHADTIYKAKYNEANTDTGTFAGDGTFGTGVSTSHLSPIQKAWGEDAEWIQKFKRLPGMTSDKMRERATAQNRSEEDYVKHYENKNAMSIHNSDNELARYGVN
ncbi:unnamed protein product, partial [marine sediment metagenome]